MQLGQSCWYWWFCNCIFLVLYVFSIPYCYGKGPQCQEKQCWNSAPHKRLCTRHHISSSLALEIMLKWDLSGDYTRYWPFAQEWNFISSDRRGKSKAGYTQSGVPMESTHMGTVSSLALEPRCYMSQEHHDHDVWVVSDPLTSAQHTDKKNPTKQKNSSWLNSLVFRRAVTKSSFYFTNLIKLISMDRLTNYLLP